MTTGNRFKKSVENATQNTSANIKESISDVIEDSIKYNAVYDNKESAVYSTQEKTIENKVHDAQTSILDDILKSNKKDRGKNHTIYLSADVGNALDRQVKQSGMSKSELVDKILHKVLIGNTPRQK